MPLFNGEFLFTPAKRASGLYRCFWKELNMERNLFCIVCFDFTAQAQFCVMDAFFIQNVFSSV